MLSKNSTKNNMKDSKYQYYRGFIILFSALTIAVTSGFGVDYLLTINGRNFVYRQIMALVIGSGLALVYTLAELRQRNYREKMGDNSNGF